MRALDYRRAGSAEAAVELVATHPGARFLAGGSNLVDSVVRSLRKKLGDEASAIETVRGYGYRLRRM